MTFNKLASEICDGNTKNRLIRGLIQPSLHQLRQQLKDKLGEFLEPHISVHPISYNDYLVSSVQDIQSRRHKRKFDRVAKAACNFDTTTALPGVSHPVHLKLLLDKLLEATDPDVREYSASLAADVAAAYYKASDVFYLSGTTKENNHH